MLSIDQIKQSKDFVVEKISVWDGDLYVREMASEDRDQWESDAIKFKEEHPNEILANDVPANFRARMAVATVCNESGELLFTYEDLDWLGKKGCAALVKIYNVATRLNGFGKDDIEDLVKNSESAPSESSE